MKAFDLFDDDKVRVVLAQSRVCLAAHIPSYSLFFIGPTDGKSVHPQPPSRRKVLTRVFHYLGDCGNWVGFVCVRERGGEGRGFVCAYLVYLFVYVNV